MNDQAHKDKGFLRDKLGDYQVNPPEKVWSSISDQLGGGRSRRSMLILVISAAASLALAVTLGIHYFGPDLPEETGLAEESGLSEDLAPSEARVPESRAPESLSPLEEKVIEALESTATEGKEVLEAEDQALLTKPEPSDEPQITRLEPYIQPEGEVREALLEEAEQEVQTEQAVQSESDVQPEQAERDQRREDLSEAESQEASDPLENSDPEEVLPLLGDETLSSDPLPEFMDDKNKDVRWMVGAALSPLYSFRDAESSVMAGAGVHESGIISYSSGVHVNYRRGSRLSFETGIFFNKTGVAIGASGIQSFNQQSDFLLFGAGSESADIKAVTNSVGNIISNSGEIYVNGYKMNAQNTPEALLDENFQRQGSVAEGIKQHLDYLELPFNLRYTVIDRAFELQLVGGLSTNFLVNNYVTMDTPSGREEIGYLSNIRTVNYSGNAGLGMIYHLGKNLNFMLEPRFRYFLNSINDASLPTTRPYSLGLYTSLNFTF